MRSKKVVERWYQVNDGTRSLFESAVSPEVESALRDWAKASVNCAVLIGGMAISFWGLPRHTQDADFLFLSAGDVSENIPGFKRVRPHAFQHNITHVEVEVLYPGFISMPVEVARAIHETSVVDAGLRIASKNGLIASKLYRFSRQDQADIETLINLGGTLEGMPVGDDEMQKYESIKSTI